MSAIKEDKKMLRHQEGYIWRKGRNWYGRWWEDVIEEGHEENGDDPRE